ncbi:uncharacterized protein [Anas platyrhynchos]|uniref:uncharacterized protein isoform X2 n=1 Tax=Anas platyrhynchos TaxID=8839 RepID=UPI003AF2C7F8
MAALARSVLVTGSNRGIGLELVRQLAASPQPPQHIFATCRDPDGPRGKALRELSAQHPSIRLVQLDTVDLPSIRRAVQVVESCLEGQGLNLLINNAGIGSHATLQTVDSQEMLAAFATNVVGPLQVTKEFLPLLEKAAKGAQKTGLSCSRAAIVNVSSKVGSIGLCLRVLEAPMYPYRASKVRGWGRRWGPWRGAHGTPPPTPGHPSPAWSSKGEHAERQPRLCPCSTAGQSPFPTSTALQLQNVPLPPTRTQLPEPSVVLAWPCLFQAAQNMVTRCLAAELRDKGILCTAIHPGWVKTDMGTEQAPMTVERSVQGILAVLGSLSQETSGAFLDWEGNSLPW